jgi:hypothetical protein
MGSISHLFSVTVSEQCSLGQCVFLYGTYVKYRSARTSC